MVWSTKGEWKQQDKVNNTKCVEGMKLKTLVSAFYHSLYTKALMRRIQLERPSFLRALSHSKDQFCSPCQGLTDHLQPEPRFCGLIIPIQDMATRGCSYPPKLARSLTYLFFAVNYGRDMISQSGRAKTIFEDRALDQFLDIAF